MHWALRQAAANIKSSHFRRIAVVLCLTFAVSGILQVGGAHAVPETTSSALLAASKVANPTAVPCENDPAHDVDERCVSAAGCAFIVAMTEEAKSGAVRQTATARADADIIRGAIAVPLAPPPKFAVRV
jgi:hypothetical protein